MLLKTSTIRGFTSGDVPAVAALWQRCFRHTEQPPSAAIKDYFEEIFFHNPWHDEGLSSLVYEGDAGEVIGFIGVIPRLMTLAGHIIRVAIATQLMVDPAKRKAFAALELIRALFAGPQDLTYSDGANAVSERIWRAAGGDVARLYSLEWRRTLRPAESFANRFESRLRSGMLARSAVLAGRCMDTLAAALRVPQYLSPAPSACTSEPLSSEAMLRDFDRFVDPRLLRPVYERSTLAWLLEQASRARRLGNLHSMLVRDHSGQVAGWYIYYGCRGRPAELLQLAAHPTTIGLVLDSLFHDAFRTGAISISGQAVPHFLADISARRCRITCPGGGALTHSRHPEIVTAIHRGDAFLSRLDGEWWLRLGIDRKLDW